MCIDKEVWKDVVGYEGLYQVSDHGRVRSLERVVKTSDGRVRRMKGKFLSIFQNGRGYSQVTLCLRGKTSSKHVHKLAAEAFLGHSSCGMKEVVDHIDHDKTNNHLSNLRLVTQRENTSHRKKKGTSQYPGVYWHSLSQKWIAQITLGKTRKHLGLFTCEHEAANAYQKALENVH